ncbi:sensor domain-containing diguanylate cyclase [Desulfurobacterium crinifex]
MNKVSPESSTLIQVFTSHVDKEEIRSIQKEITRVFPEASIIGVSTAGAIANGEIVEKGCVLSVTQFDRTNVKIALSAEEDSFQRGVEIAKYVNSSFPKAKLMISFTDGIFTNGEDFLKGIQSVDSDITVTGGMAGDNLKFEKTYVFTDKEILDRGTVCAILEGENLKYETDYCFGWKPIGRTFTITKVEDNRVYEIEGVPALDFYASYLGKEVVSFMPNISLAFPLIIEKNGIPVARACIRVNKDKSLSFGGNFSQGEQVRFGIGLPPQILKECKDKLKIKDMFKPQCIFVFSCAARKSIMSSYIKKEINLFSPYPVAGFFTYGEFFSHNGKKEFLNQTATILFLSESEESGDDTKEKPFLIKENGKDRSFYVKDFKTILTIGLINLVDRLSIELNEKNKELERISRIDYLTGVYNRLALMEFLEREVERAKKYKKPLSVLLLDIDDFKHINDTQGHLVGDKVLKELVEEIRKNIRKVDMLGRYGGEEFVVVLPEIGLREAREVAEKIRKRVEKRKFTHSLKVTISIGVTELDLLKDTVDFLLSKADNAMYMAKRKGKNKVCLNA